MTPVLILALLTGAILFGVGIYGALSQTNLVMIMMGVELIVGFGVAIARFRAKGSVEMEEAGDLQG